MEERDESGLVEYGHYTGGVEWEGGRMGEVVGWGDDGKIGGWGEGWGEERDVVGERCGGCGGGGFGWGCAEGGW